MLWWICFQKWCLWEMSLYKDVWYGLRHDGICKIKLKPLITQPFKYQCIYKSVGESPMEIY